MLKRTKNPACLICKHVIAKDSEPYCTIKHAFTETLSPILCEPNCPDRHTFVDDMPDILNAKDMFKLLRRR